MKMREAITKKEIYVLDYKWNGRPVLPDEDHYAFSFKIPKGSKCMRCEDEKEFGLFFLEQFTPGMKADIKLFRHLEEDGFAIDEENLLVLRDGEPGFDEPLVALLGYLGKSLKDDWKLQHVAAMAYPNQFERGFIKMLRGWLEFADQHKKNSVADMTDERPEMSFDSYGGPLWAQIGWNLNSLLSCELGCRLDMGTLSSILYMALEREGYNMDDI